jgi:hypothetical protein
MELVAVKALVAGSGNGETMRLIILLLALIIGAAYIQSVRNHCHLDDVPKWAECVTKPSW